MAHLLYQVILLGVVQGIAEFLPISSSGHLVLAGALLGFEGDRLGMVIWLHVGTLGATCAVYRREIFCLLRGDWQLAFSIAIALVPGGVLGLTLGSKLESVFESLISVSLLLWVTATTLVVGEWLFLARDASREQVRPKEAVWIGIAQATALLPGISRSGVTIAAGLACGIRREAAARFSFLLAIPTVGGAALVEWIRTVQHGEITMDFPTVLVGILASFVAGVLALNVLIALLRRYPMYVFSVYCFLVGGFVLMSEMLSLSGYFAADPTTTLLLSICFGV